jgi:hypothetical protein
MLKKSEQAGEEMEIRSISGALLWKGAAGSLRVALERAVEAHADLHGANLCGADLRSADLHGANLRGADLRRADLRRADLSWANLRVAYLNGADLRGVDLCEADLSGADLRVADLRVADLRVAYLSGANLSEANLSEANLSSICEDLYVVLSVARAEAPGLLIALREGRVDGSVYEGECACLVGTIANLRGEAFRAMSIDLRPDSSRLAERWFLAIEKGDTPANSPIVAIMVGWIEAWLEENKQSEKMC